MRTWLAFVFSMAACATVIEVDWQPRIGHFSLDEARHELGAPESCVGLDDGGNACSWRGSSVGGMDKLILTFDPKGQLATANKVHF